MVRLTVAACLGLCVALFGANPRVHAQGPAVAAPPAALAPPAGDRIEEAKALFAAGRAAFEAGRYQDALGHFERCYEISQRAALLYNIALTHDRLRDDEKALASYDAYLAAVPAAENRVEVETRSAALRDALARRQQAAPVGPTPAETAAAAPAASPEPDQTQVASSPRDDDGGLLGKWWFWTIVGVAVAGGVTAGIVVATRGEDDPSPLAPKSGVVVTTLSVSR